MKRAILFLVVLIALLPVRAFASGESPSVTSVSVQYPHLDDGFIPNTLRYPFQTAVKDGDQISVAAQIESASPLSSASLDASAAGTGVIPLSIQATGATTYQAQSEPFSLTTHGVNGALSLPLIIGTSDGTVTQAIPLTFDNTPPAVSIRDFFVASASPSQGSPLTISGALDGTGTIGRLFRIFVSLLFPDGSRSSGNEYYSEQEGSALRALGNGPFAGLTLPIVETTADLAKAAAITISLLAKDEAGNLASTSASFALASSSEPLATSSPPDGTLVSRDLSPLHSSVLFLPGIETSRLYVPATTACDPHAVSCAERLAWELSSDASLHDLAFNPGGTSVHEAYAKAGDLVTVARSAHLPLSRSIYSGFFSLLDKLRQQGQIAEWIPLAYDWRLSPEMIVRQGAQSGTASFMRMRRQRHT